MMRGENRRKELLKLIMTAEQTMTATELSKHFGVSRQVIVGDVALLRAQNNEIIATKVGYRIKNAKKELPYIKHLELKHSKEQTEEELKIFIRNGVFVRNVMVEHNFYGNITCDLNIETLDDIKRFLRSIERSGQKLLSELTGGVHIHTIACKDEDHFKKVYQSLDERGFIYQ
ncbi:MAG: transcription repressor NadR [Defluviitaleaceae bacterium]|nr:transcription repressor NadR [Defluviitaleaceae bacterium]